MSVQSSPRFNFVIDTDLGERKIDREDELLADLEKLFTAHFQRQYSKRRPAQRAVHAKSHGCLKATFEVLDHGDTELAHGIFKKPGSYESRVRFSNGDGPAGDDRAKLISVGIGIKVLGVKGPKLLPTQTEETQDFLMINQPEFIVADVQGFKRIIDAREGGLFKKAVAIFHHWRGLRERRKASPKDNPLNLKYWSVTPFQLGSTTVKYLIRRINPESKNIPSDPDENYLRASVERRIKDREVSYDFFLQKRIFNGREEKEMPIEDNTVEWIEDENVNLVPVGRLTIPAQELGISVPKDVCERLIFTPWNTTQDFRPMSSLNRARKIIYELSSLRRHQINESSNPITEGSHGSA